MSNYHFHARNGHFYVAADNNYQQDILDRILKEKDGSIDCCIVAPCTNNAGMHLQASVLNSNRQIRENLKTAMHDYIIYGVNDEEEKKDADADYDAYEGSDNEEDEEDRPTTPLPSLKYEVYLRFNMFPTIRERKWAYSLFNPSPTKPRFVSACTAMMAVNDDVIVQMMMNVNRVMHGSPSLCRDATLRLLDHSFGDSGGDQLGSKMASIIIKCIKENYSKARSDAAVQKLFKQWMADKSIVTPTTRLQPERAAPAYVDKDEFIQLPTKAGRAWIREHIGPPSLPFAERLRDRRPTLVICGVTRSVGKSRWAQSHGKHIYMEKILQPGLLYDCMNDQEAQYVVLDEIPWSALMDTRRIGVSIIGGQPSTMWKKDRHNYAIPLGLPVIITCNSLPRQEILDQWAGRFVIVRIEPETMMYRPRAASSAVAVVEPVSVGSLLSRSTTSLAMESSAVPSPAVFSLSSSASTLPQPLVVKSTSSRPSSLAAIVPAGVNWMPSFPNMRVLGEGDSYYIPNFLTKQEADAVLADIGNELNPLYVGRRHPTVLAPMYGVLNGVARDKAALGDIEGTRAGLYGYGAPELAPVKPWPPTLLRCRDLIFERIGVRCNHAIANAYQGKNDVIGPHRDKDRDFVPNGIIATISVGDTRCLSMTKAEKTGEKKEKLMRKTNKIVLVDVKKIVDSDEVMMEHGSLTIIGCRTNTLWKHAVPQMKAECGVRYGVTYRCIGTVWDMATGEIVNQNGKRKQALRLLDKQMNPLLTPEGGPRWTLSKKYAKSGLDVTRTRKPSSSKKGKKKKRKHESSSESEASESDANDSDDSE
jgi:alkylated DNA repair dioxygenase AlkB